MLHRRDREKCIPLPLFLLSRPARCFQHEPHPAGQEGACFQLIPRISLPRASYRGCERFIILQGGDIAVECI